MTWAQHEVLVFLAKLRAAEADAAQQTTDRGACDWRVRGKTGFDALERISTQVLLDILEVPQLLERTTGTYRHLAKGDD